MSRLSPEYLTIDLIITILTNATGEKNSQELWAAAFKD
jgi:hypothetical protein